jgi:hypothetical protein
MEQPFTELAAAGEKITQYYAPTPLGRIGRDFVWRQWHVGELTKSRTNPFQNRPLFCEQFSKGC